MKKINSVLLFTFFVSVLFFCKSYAEKKPPVKTAYTDTQTQVKFPDMLGGLSYTNVIHNQQNAGLGVSINYSNSEISAEISIYNLGLPKIQEADMEKAFESSKQAIYTLDASSKYKNIEQLKNQPSHVTIGNTKFSYAMFTYLAAGKISYDQVIAEIFLTQYKNHFLKVQVISSKESQQKSVDNFIRGLKSLLK